MNNLKALVESLKSAFASGCAYLTPAITNFIEHLFNVI